MSKKQVPKFLCYLTWFWILTKLILDQSSLIWKVVTVAHGTSVRESKSKRGPSFKPAGTFWIQHFPKNNVWTWTKPHCWLISGTTWQFDAIQVPVYPFLKPTYVVSCEALLKVQTFCKHPSKPRYLKNPKHKRKYIAPSNACIHVKYCRITSVMSCLIPLSGSPCGPRSLGHQAL